MVIWKYSLNTKVGAPLIRSIEMPKGAEILDVQMQNGEVEIWALVRPEVDNETRKFTVYMTGFELPDNPGRYIATLQKFGGALVYHVFEV